jgi:hypothetical protein
MMNDIEEREMIKEEAFRGVSLYYGKVRRSLYLKTISESSVSS